MSTISFYHEWFWQTTPTRALAVVLIACAVSVGVWRFYRAGESRVPVAVGLRRAMMAARLTVIGLIALLLLGPSRVRVERQYALPQLILLRDVSQSMSLEDDHERRIPRIQLVDQLLTERVAERPRDWARRAHLRLIDFATGSVERELPELEGRPSETMSWPTGKAEGRGTEIAAALRAALRDEPPVAVVLFSDGQATGADDLEAVATEFANRQVPIFTVGLGSTQRPRNVAVTAVYVRPRVWKGEAFEVEAWLTAEETGAASCQLEVSELRLTEAGEPSERRVVERRMVALNSSGEAIRMMIPRVAEQPGRYRYEVRVLPLADEVSLDDNVRVSTPLEVLDRDQLRTLIVSGAPTWDYQLLERILPRDATLASSFWLQSRDGERGRGGSRPITELPASREALFEYDVLLLLDPDPDELPPDWGELAAAFVEEHRGGLLYVPGPHHAARWIDAPGTAPLRDLLPVSWPDSESIAATELLDSHTRGWPLRVVPTEREHPILRELSAAGDDNDAKSNEPVRPSEPARPSESPALPDALLLHAPVFWSFPTTTVRPTARVLLEHGDPSLRTPQGARPLLVVDRYRAARVAYLGTQGTWRWKSNRSVVAASTAAGSSVPAPTSPATSSPERSASAISFTWGERLWLQLIRFLAEGRAEESERRGYLQTDRGHYEVGERISISWQRTDATESPAGSSPAGSSAGAVPPTANPSRAAANSGSTMAPVADGGPLVGFVEVGTQRHPLLLHPSSERPGWYAASWVAREAERHRFQFDASASSPALEAEVSVEWPRRETARTWLDRERLQQIAKRSGGRYFDWWELDQLTSVLPDRRAVIEIRQTPEPIWDRGWFLLLVVGLLGFEWSLRRRVRWQ